MWYTLLLLFRLNRLNVWCWIHTSHFFFSEIDAAFSTLSSPLSPLSSPLSWLLFAGRITVFNTLTKLNFLWSSRIDLRFRTVRRSCKYWLMNKYPATHKYKLFEDTNATVVNTCANELTLPYFSWPKKYNNPPQNVKKHNVNAMNS